MFLYAFNKSFHGSSFLVIVIICFRKLVTKYEQRTRIVDSFSLDRLLGYDYILQQTYFKARVSNDNEGKQ